MSLMKAFLVAACATAFSIASANAQTEIKFGHVGAPGSLFAQSAELFAQKANAKLGSKAKIVVYGSSQLGSDSELLKKLKLGTVDLEAARLRLVGHVERQRHRNAEFREQRSQRQRAAQVLGVAHVNQGAQRFM